MTSTLTQATQDTLRAISRSDLDYEILLAAYRIGYLAAIDEMREQNEHALDIATGTSVPNLLRHQAA